MNFRMNWVTFSKFCKYSILKYISSLLVLDNQKQHCCMGITVLTKEIKPKIFSIKMKCNIGMMCLQKGR